MRFAVALMIALGATPSHADSGCLCLPCIKGFIRSFIVTSGHMKPTLEPGACVMAHLQGVGTAAPHSGQIAAFSHPVTGEVHLSRVIAIGGQTVQMVNGRLLVDGTPVALRPAPDYLQRMEREGPIELMPLCAEPVAYGEICRISRLTEVLPNGATYAVLDTVADGVSDNTPLFIVPLGYIFVMGDHRDNSVDSRFPQTSGGPGFVAVDLVLGTVTGILT